MRRICSIRRSRQLRNGWVLLLFLASLALVSGLPTEPAQAGGWDCNADPNPTYCSGDCIGNCHILFFDCQQACWAAYGTESQEAATCELRCESRFVHCLERCPI